MEEEQTIELTYIRWACDCPNWATEKDYKKYWDSPDDSLADRCVYIEPADPSLELPESAENARAVRFTGKFYKRKGFPKGHFSIEQPDKARVFRYTKYKVLKRRTK